MPDTTYLIRARQLGATQALLDMALAELELVRKEISQPRPSIHYLADCGARGVVLHERFEAINAEAKQQIDELVNPKTEVA